MAKPGNGDSGRRPPRGGGKGGRGGRRTPPPDSTGLEQRFLAHRRGRDTRMVVRTVDGQEIKGKIVEFDADLIEVTPYKGPKQVLRKSDIVYIHDDEDH